MKTQAPNPSLIAVIGDVHHHIGLAAQGLREIESDLNRPIAQVFSVGDFGLFLNKSDWDFLSGPSKYRQPENSPKIRAAWAEWTWPISIIGGNHEPFHLLRDWCPAAFGGKLEYTDAGELRHSIDGLRVTGLSGIYHPEHLEFVGQHEAKLPMAGLAESWPRMVELARAGVISRKLLSYYKQQEIDLLCSLGFTPDLLLLHDWPIQPAHVHDIHGTRPEAKIQKAIQPRYLCCGHHHSSARFTIQSTEVIALNLITNKERIHQRKIQSGWAALFEWGDQSLRFLQLWPEI